MRHQEICISKRAVEYRGNESKTMNEDKSIENTIKNPRRQGLSHVQQEVLKLLDHTYDYQNLSIKHKPRARYF